MLIVDWDVHHGNGTQALVQDTEDIRFVSIHQWPSIWARARPVIAAPGLIWNVLMAAGLPAARYVDAFGAALRRRLRRGGRRTWCSSSAGFDSLNGE